MRRLFLSVVVLLASMFVGTALSYDYYINPVDNVFKTLQFLNKCTIVHGSTSTNINGVNANKGHPYDPNSDLILRCPGLSDFHISSVDLSGQGIENINLDITFKPYDKGCAKSKFVAVNVDEQDDFWCVSTHG